MWLYGSGGCVFYMYIHAPVNHMYVPVHMHVIVHVGGGGTRDENPELLSTALPLTSYSIWLGWLASELRDPPVYPQC